MFHAQYKNTYTTMPESDDKTIVLFIHQTARPRMWAQATIIHLGLTEVGMVWNVTKTHNARFQLKLLMILVLGPKFKLNDLC